MGAFEAAPDHGEARWATAVAVCFGALAVLSVGWMLARGRSIEVLYARWMLHNAPVAIAVLWLGRAMLRRDPRHGLGLTFIALGVPSALHVAVFALADARLEPLGITSAELVVAPASLPLDVAVLLWLGAWLWLVPATLVTPLLLLLFPDGRLPHPGWRACIAVAFTGTACLIAAYGISVWPTVAVEVEMSGQPIMTPLTQRLTVIGGILSILATIAAAVALVGRWRGAPADERSPYRTVGVAAIVVGAVLLGLFPWQEIWIPASLISLLAFLLVYTVAVLRYGLHEIDVVLNRTVVATALLVLVTGIYLALVVGLGSIVGRSADHELLPLIAVGVVAVLFEPARRRVRRTVDRALYGRDADAYEVLSELAHLLEGAGSAEDVATHVADLLVRGTGATGGVVSLQVDGEERELARSGPEAPDLPVVARADVVHDGVTIGSAALLARSPGQLAPDAALLLHDVAGTLGAVLRNAILTAQLRDQVDELRTSRQRLVAAQDQARRSLERDLHDGAQARLVAIRLQVGRAVALAEGTTDPALRRLLDDLAEQSDAAIRSLRELSRGINPPLLGTDGVAAALRAALRGLPLELDVRDHGVGRLPPDVEAAAYFACLEAVHNAVRHGAAGHVQVELRRRDDGLTFDVVDDGCGFDPNGVPGASMDGAGLRNLADRIEALEGALTIDAAPGRGTRLHGTIPVPA